MKATINLSDSLFVTAKAVAAQQGIAISMLVERALRNYLVKTEAGRRHVEFHLADGSFKGQAGLQPGIDPNDWAQIRELSHRD